MEKLTETPSQAPVEITFNVIDGPSNKQLNEKPLTLEEAKNFAKQLHESDAGASLIIRSNKATIMG
jgi:hypothetical protein